jgi:hypothetical protein
MRSPRIARGLYRKTGSAVRIPFVISWKNRTMAYAVQNERRRSSRVRSRARSSRTASRTPTTARTV